MKDYKKTRYVTMEFTYKPKPILVIGTPVDSLAEANRIIKDKYFERPGKVRIQSIDDPVKGLVGKGFVIFTGVKLRNVHKLIEYAEDGIKVGNRKHHPSIIGTLDFTNGAKLSSICDVVDLREQHKVTSVSETPQVVLEMTPEKAKKMSMYLADLLCWWQGFRAGTRSIDEYSQYLATPQYGIEAARDLKDMLDRKTK